MLTDHLKLMLITRSRALKNNLNIGYVLIVIFMFWACGCKERQVLRIASFNLLSSQFKFDMDLGSNSLGVEERRQLQMLYIDSLKPDLLLLQEAEPLYGQVDYLQSNLSAYGAIKGSNGLALLFNSDQLELEEYGYIDSIGLQYGTFRALESGRIVHAMNVHLAGGDGSILNLRKIISWASARWDLTKESTVLAGDMNIQLTSKYYSAFIEEFPFFSDPNYLKVKQNKTKQIDWILLNQGFDVLNSGWEQKKMKGHFVSDHPSVWADVELSESNAEFNFQLCEGEGIGSESKVQESLVEYDSSLPDYFSLHGSNYFLATNNEEIINTKKYSVSFWIKASQQNNQLGQNYLLANQGYPFGWEIEIRSGVIYFEARLESEPGRKSRGLKIVGTTPVLPEEWHHVLLSIDVENEAKLYLNGILEGAVELNGSISYHPENPGIFVGTRWDLRNMFKGKITQPVFFEGITGEKELEKFYKEGSGSWDKIPMVNLEFEEYEQNFDN